ncbi:hypothetical protein Pan216_08440 [Planctomycetes bacterium Pan216]|uniref:Uncharacterized protein n=1 Tax=Kolteria novifilia TaxID=2527975 RepID=A0A518AZ52_9BACT|nr:hypothetical protein Pan216_08440 [Planctomycetes bacterium Pan216]
MTQQPTISDSRAIGSNSPPPRRFRLRLAVGGVEESAHPAIAPDDRASDVATRRYYEKEILRAGRWETPQGPWRVTQQTLRRLADSWRRARGRGVRIPVVWNHSDDARDKIGELTALVVVDNGLVARFWAASHDDVRRIGTTVQDVSVEVQAPWRDGAGHRYDMMLTHLALVSLPVVSDQQPFRQLALSSKGESAMPKDHRSSPATDLAPNTPDASPPKESSSEFESVSISDVIAAINALLDASGLGLKLPPDTNAETLLDELLQLKQRVLDDQVTEEDAEHSVPRSGDAPTDVHQLQLALDRTTRRLAAERRKSLAQRERHFTNSLDRLVRQGRILPARRADLLETGASIGFRLSLLTPFEDIPSEAALPLRRRTRQAATSQPPVVGARNPMSPQRAREIARGFRPE